MTRLARRPPNGSYGVRWLVLVSGASGTSMVHARCVTPSGVCQLHPSYHEVRCDPGGGTDVGAGSVWKPRVIPECVVGAGLDGWVVRPGEPLHAPTRSAEATANPRHLIPVRRGDDIPGSTRRECSIVSAAPSTERQIWRYGLHAGARCGVLIVTGAPKSNRSSVIVCVEVGSACVQWMRRSSSALSTQMSMGLVRPPPVTT